MYHSTQTLNTYSSIYSMQITPSSRELRGKEKADKGNVKKVNDNSFKVKSQSGKGAYEVKATPNGMTCTWPDFVYR